MELHTFKIQKQIDHFDITLYPTLIEINARHYLVDCGYEETFPEFIAGLKKLGVEVEDLYAILISHDDIDHLGALKLFKDKNPGLIICGSEIEAPSICGRVQSERLLQAEKSLFSLPEAHQQWALHFIHQLKNIQRVPVDIILKNHDKIEEEMEVVYTPGHTKGHISFYIAMEETLIANDALVIEGGDFDLANPTFTLDIHQAINSVELIKTIGPKKIVCYHGGIADVDVAQKLSKLISKYQDYR